MLDYQYIKDESLWVIKYESGYRKECKGSEVDAILKRDYEEISDNDVVSWKFQPKELQEFWKAYEYSQYVLNKRELYDVDDFYKEWIKNPNQFKAEHRPVIGTLFEELSKWDKNADMCIVNYDGQFVVGNHHINNFLLALKQQGVDFDVVSIEEGQYYPTMTIQDDDEEKLEMFSKLANRISLREALK